MSTTTLHGFVEVIAGKHPDRVCLRHAERPGMSYGEVWRSVERCASHCVLLDGEVIALVADRSYGLVISLLGVLRSGKAYTPIEPDFPHSRAHTMLETAGIRYALVPAHQVPQPVLYDCDVSALAVHDDGRVCQAEDDRLMPADANRLPRPVPDSATAYVLFTSGSTGKPKGCMVPHRGSALYAQAVVQHCGLDEDMVFLLKTPYVFDVSVQDLFTCFCVGGSLEIADPGAHKDAGAIADIISTRGVNCACFVPTLLVEFVNYLERNPEEARQVKKSLKRVLTIGEALMTSTCKQLFGHLPDLEIHNLYGPTEASVGVSHFKVTDLTAGSLGTVVPIGKPFSYVNFCVFDPADYEDCSMIEEGKLKPTRPGEIGELFIGGDCLAKGYMKNEEKTSAAFFHFPGLCQRPTGAASPFSLYKTGDLCRVENGIFHYVGRNDFQVKISGVRIECEEVSAVLKTHPVVGDALVTAFDSPFGKALAAYVVTTADWQAEQDKQGGDEILNVNNWGAVYDEMYKETDNSVSVQDPTLNWSGYTDTYSRRPHIEPVIREWVEWSCEQVSAHRDLLQEGGRRPTITELGCGNGMLLFRLAPLLGSTGLYIGTDISTRALETVQELKKTLPQYQHLNVDTKALAAHEIFDVCSEKENDMVLCNGVTMYFPSANYLLKCLQLSAQATRDGGLVIYGDIQSRRHVLAFRAHVETYQALRRQDATAAAVLHAAKQSVASEELSYFDDALFHRLDRVGRKLFENRLARVEMRVKRGWWHSEFNRFRYDVWLVLGDGETSVPSPKLQMVEYVQLCEELHLQKCARNSTELVDPRLVDKLEGWVVGRLSAATADIDGFVVTLPNARTFAATKLLEWLEKAAKENAELATLPGLLHPADACQGSVEESAKFGVEPEMLFTMDLPRGWTQRVIWAEDPGFLRLVLLRDAAALGNWLSAATEASFEELPEDLTSFKNQPEDVDVASFDPMKACNEVMKAWASGTSLLPAMRPAVYIPLQAFPKNTAGKIDRAALPDAAVAFEEIANVNSAEYEPPATDEERQMVAVWEKVLKVQVGVLTPFVAYGGHSLTAVQLCSSVNATFDRRPDLVFLMSEDCTVRALLAKLQKDNEAPSDDGCVVRLSPSENHGMPMLIFCAAGTSATSYAQVAERATRMQIFAVELPGRGRRAHEPVITQFERLFDNLKDEVMSWARQHKRFYAWGDSLGAVIAYEFARLWQADGDTNLMGLYASGNAGPPEASKERGMGEAVMDYLGLQRSCAADMTSADWKRFLLASAGEGHGRQELEALLDNPEMADSIVQPLRADCLVYESYHLDRAERIKSPIITLRGGRDVVTSSQAIRSWRQVAGSRFEHKEVGQHGHMLARECPHLLAEMFMEYSLPDFTHELRHFETFRAAYRLMRMQAAEGKTREIRKSMRVCSPTIGASKVPQDLEFAIGCENLNLELLETETITPPTKEVKAMRVGNLTWRRGASAGNPTRLP
mmetsp:Transcript_49844/g.116280  ORF Transcript_49844/g.116280 Transcript_49844/m.116280 type:complete len:1480 (-) Transcript_49844:74-4513(-)